MQFISLKAPCCLPHLNGVTGAVSCTGDVLVSRSTGAGGWAYLGDLFHNCRACRSVLSIPFGITLGSHQCTRLEKKENRQLFAYSGVWWVCLSEMGIQGKLAIYRRNIWRRCERAELHRHGGTLSLDDCVRVLARGRWRAHWSLWIERRRHKDVEELKSQNLCSADPWSPNHENQFLNASTSWPAATAHYCRCSVNLSDIKTACVSECARRWKI